MRRIVGAVVALAALLSLFAGPAAAQDESETFVGGTIRERATEAGGEDTFFSGVEITVTDAEGNVIGVGVTDELGEWQVILPGGGEYSSSLDVETLPEGVSLRNPDNAVLTFELNEGRSRNVLYPLGELAVAESSTIPLVQLTVDGIRLGLIIAMCAIGLSLIFGTTGLVNFAHGEMVTFGAVVALIISEYGFFGGLIGPDWEVHLLVAAVVTIVFAGAAGGAFNAFVWRPLRKRGASLIAQLVVSIGFSIMFRYIILFQLGGRDRRFRDYQLQETIDFGWFTMTPKDVIIVIISSVVLIGVGLALQRTRIGKAMRAVSDNRDLAESSGIDVEKVIRTVWIAGGALAGLGGVLFGLTETIGWEMGFRILLLMFAGVTLGGLGTAYGALFGSLIVGVFIQTSTLVIPSDMKNAGALLVLALILLVKPQGLLGRAERIG